MIIFQFFSLSSHGLIFDYDWCLNLLLFFRRLHEKKTETKKKNEMKWNEISLNEKKRFFCSIWSWYPDKLSCLFVFLFSFFFYDNNFHWLSMITLKNDGKKKTFSDENRQWKTFFSSSCDFSFLFLFNTLAINSIIIINIWPKRFV